MLKLLPRILLGLSSLALLATGLSLWFTMPSALAGMGLTAADLAGRSTVRSALGGLFAGCGALQLLAAIRQSPQVARCALVMTGAVLTGRLIGIVTDGANAAIWQGMAIEAAVAVILSWAQHVWRGPTGAGR